MILIRNDRYYRIWSIFKIFVIVSSLCHHVIISQKFKWKCFKQSLMTFYYHIWPFKINRTAQNFQKSRNLRWHILAHLPVIWGILWGPENGDKCHISTSRPPRGMKFCRHLNRVITRRYQSPAKETWSFFVG